eukprot:10035524-Ditylum_brightwellii.AAC.1
MASLRDDKEGGSDVIEGVVGVVKAGGWFGLGMVVFDGPNIFPTCDVDMYLPDTVHQLMYGTWLYTCINKSTSQRSLPVEAIRSDGLNQELRKMDLFWVTLVLKETSALV